MNLVYWMAYTSHTVVSSGLNHHRLMSTEPIIVNLTGFFALVHQRQEQWTPGGAFIAQPELPLEVMRTSRCLQGENQGFRVYLHIYIRGSGRLPDAIIAMNYSWKLYQCQFCPITSMCHQLLQWVGCSSVCVSSRRNMHFKKITSENNYDSHFPGVLHKSFGKIYIFLQTFEDLL